MIASSLAENVSGDRSPSDVPTDGTDETAEAPEHDLNCGRPTSGWVFGAFSPALLRFVRPFAAGEHTASGTGNRLLSGASGALSTATAAELRLCSFPRSILPL